MTVRAIADIVVSMLSFVAIADGVGGYDADLKRVVLHDLLGSAFLIGGAVLGSVGADR